MNHSLKIEPRGNLNSLHLEELESVQTVPQESLGTDFSFKDVTGEGSKNSFFYSLFKKMVTSAYYFFSYVSRCVTSCFSSDSFRDITPKKTSSESDTIIPKSAEAIVERAAATIVKQYKEEQHTIQEYGYYYSEGVDFYQQQEEILTNYLEYLRDAFQRLQQEVKKTQPLQKKECVSNTIFEENVASSYFLFALMNSLNEEVESLKEYSELAVLLINTKAILVENKTENNKTLFFSGKELAFMIKGQLDYFRMHKKSNEALNQEMETLIEDLSGLVVFFDPKENRIIKTEYAGRKIPQEKLPKESELPEIKKTAEYTQLSLLHYMSLFKKKTEEQVMLLNQILSNYEGAAVTRLKEKTKKEHQAYRQSVLRYPL